ncbi:uncharacterized protein JCM15063_004073 [Sporobolomyces koalae]|uniref:uncharacterized protein n=1 Tax=Sporobolomyces koalae TaxID=500713 RepID=UPI00317C4883
MMYIAPFVLALYALFGPSQAGPANHKRTGQLSWESPGFSFDRPVAGGTEVGWHEKDPRDGCNYLGYGFTGNDRNGYDFKNRGFAHLLDVDLDFFVEFEFKHFQIFEYSKSRTVNYTATDIDVAADQKARLAAEAREGVATPNLDADAQAKDQLLAQDGKDVNAQHQSGSIRDKLTLTAKRYDELKFKLKTHVEIEEIVNQKKKLGQASRIFGVEGAGQ